MDSWDKLPTYLLEATPPFSSANSARTASKSAAPVSRIPDSTLPPDDRILPRLLGALERGLNVLPPGLGFPNVVNALRDVNDDASSPIESVSEVKEHWAHLGAISKVLARQICEALGHQNVRWRSSAPKQTFSQMGDITLSVIDGNQKTTISIELRQPNHLFYHGGTAEGGLQAISKLHRGSVKGAEAMSAQLALQMRLGESTISRFGVFYAGPIFMLAELVENPHGPGTVLITSPLFSAVNTPVSNPYGGSSSHEALPSAPIIACFVVLFCQRLSEFAIETIDELASKIPNIALRNSTSRGSGEPDGDNDEEDSKHESVEHMIASKPSTSTYGARSTSNTDTVALGSALGDLFLTSLTSTPAIKVAYDYPDLSDEPRLAIPISFIASPHTNTLSSPSPDNPGQQLPLPIKTFLEDIVDDTMKIPIFTLHDSSSHSLETIVLRDLISDGRTGTAWRIASKGFESPKRVAKMMSCRHIASVIRETLFYQQIFPVSEVASLVPKYYGTYVSKDSGWYVVILEDIGDPVEGEYDNFLSEDEEEVRQLEKAFANAGIKHCDIRPSNVLRAQDGSLRLINFGYSYLKSEGASGYDSQ